MSFRLDEIKWAEGENFIIAKTVTAKLTHYRGGKHAELKVLPFRTKVELVKLNEKSVRVILTFRDKDAPPVPCSLVFSENENVELN